VYTEIGRPGNVQVYDSEIAEPHVSSQAPSVRMRHKKLTSREHTADLQDHLAQGCGIVNARIPTSVRDPAAYADSQYVSEDGFYTLIPQSPTSAEVTARVSSDRGCAVTVNFPDMVLTTPPGDVAVPPPYPGLPRQHAIHASSVSEWGCLPQKFQPPAFRVHRCHHAGLELGSEGDAFELPACFPEAIQHMSETPQSVCTSTFELITC
jgi:hypothetical protein